MENVPARSANSSRTTASATYHQSHAGTEARSDTFGSEPAPAPVATVCLHVVQAQLDCDDDGAPVLLVSDGETTVELSTGFGWCPAHSAAPWGRAADR